MKKTIQITITPEMFKIPKDKQIPALKKAAAKVFKGLHNEHFNPKMKHGWDVLYNFYVNEVFYEAFGHNLENYLLEQLAKKDCYMLKSSDKHGELVISKRTKTKRKKK